jgi:hypothetical protein
LSPPLFPPRARPPLLRQALALVYRIKASMLGDQARDAPLARFAEKRTNTVARSGIASKPKSAVERAHRPRRNMITHRLAAAIVDAGYAAR